MRVPHTCPQAPPLVHLQAPRQQLLLVPRVPWVAPSAQARAGQQLGHPGAALPGNA